MFEKILYHTTESFVNSNNIINQNQFGFQKGSGTLSATAQLITRLEALHNPKIRLGAGIFIDLKKAFVTIPHKDILDKLHRYGIRGKAHDIIKSYLNNRHHFVTVNGARSDTRASDYGVPQGSNLGPVIFLLYINDLFDIDFKGFLQLFADDAVLSYANNSILNLVSDMQYDLNLLCKWLYNNLLTLNADKTKYIIFHSPRKKIEKSSITLHTNNTIIEQVEQIKYLGLNIHFSLK